MFELKNIQYKNILKLEELTFAEGKITILTGESGSGKTTLLKLLNHLISPDQGTVLYKGKEVQEMDPVLLRREVVMLQQMPAIFPGTIRDNLVLGLKFSEKQIPDDKALEEALHTVHLEKPLDDSAENLSGGEKQRLALARVLLIDAAVYLLDEPSSALDDETADEVISSFIQHSKQKKKTMIMVTHSKRIAERFGDENIGLAQYNTMQGETHEK